MTFLFVWGLGFFLTVWAMLERDEYWYRQGHRGVGWLNHRHSSRMFRAALMANLLLWPVGLYLLVSSIIKGEK